MEMGVDETKTTPAQPKLQEFAPKGDGLEGIR